MAGKLTVKYTTGSTVYFQIFRNSDGQFWNGSTFEAYSTSNISTYKIAATELGTASGYYNASVPALSASGANEFYSAVAFVQAGGSPAESDQFIGTEDFDWNG